MIFRSSFFTDYTKVPCLWVILSAINVKESHYLKGQYTLRKLGGATPYDQKGNYFSEYLLSVKYRIEN